MAEPMMLTQDQFDEMIEFVCDRWPQASRWGSNVWRAMYETLAIFDPSDLWSALASCVNEGREYPPNASILMERATEISRFGSSQAAMYGGARPPAAEAAAAALPPPAPDPEFSIAEWMAREYPGEEISWTEHIRRWHEKHPHGCRSRFCDIHAEGKAEALA